MAKKLRKMLGDVNAPPTVALMRLIDTQSKATISSWCLGCAESTMLPIFERHCPGDRRPRGALDAARQYLGGAVKFPAVRDIILNGCHAAARELEDDPAAQAAARACGQAAAVVHTLSHSLGLLFYGAAATAYDRLGLEASDAAYAAIGEEVCAEMTAALRAVAVENEPNPARIKWKC
ncbi:MAG: hypothetical protein GX558_05580 [Clostridiales bacterium]|nr:hypothetical protein [Clostridiales bacterium]